ncbi:MAG: hypothetical protein A3F18_03800 [Legionellales bacterium RIFCSPHIGHO2_12_FULL_37_14]|nr:MAG: hypothetical protein A3F18_03800 [Legionellales bacterium RIFCSPHIGHO2_12_FULL_37_14]
MKGRFGYRSAFLGVLIVFLTSCTVGPNYTPPQARVPAKWQHGTAKKIISYGNWWRHFHDPVLNKLIEQKAPYSLNVQIAEARIEAARSLYKAAYAQLFPELTANVFPPNATGVDLAQVYGLFATFDIDLFGKKRAAKQKAQENLAAELAEKEFTILKLQAEIATAYFSLRELQAKLRILRNNKIANNKILHMLQSNYHKGTANYIGIAQQKSLIETELANKERNKALEIAMLQQLELLTGNGPGALTKLLHRYRPMPPMAPLINLTVPSELLTRRPDIIAAEKRVAAAHADLQAAWADLFPKITLGWLLAWQTQALTTNLLSLTGSQSAFFGLLDAPLLSLRLAKMIDVRKREKALTVLLYEMTVLNALHEVEIQYNYCKHYRLGAQHLQRALTHKRVVFDVARDSYKKGVADFNGVLLAEEDMNRLQMAYTHQVLAYQIALINLYKALGGDVVK